MAQFEYKDAFTQVFNERPSPFSHDRSKSFGASEAFGCIREGWFKKNTVRGKIIDWGFMERGNVIENDFVVPFMKEIFGAENCLSMGSEQMTLFDGKASATPDGLIINQPRNILQEYGVKDIGEGQCFNIEVKSFDERANVYAEKPIHRGQLIMQIGMFRETTKYQPEWGQVLYINSSDYKDMRPFTVKFDQKIYEKGLARADQLFAVEEAADLPPEGKFSGGCVYCDFHDECGEAALSRYDISNKDDDIPQKDVDKLGKLVNLVAEAKATKIAAEQREKELKYEIKTKLEGLKTNAVDQPQWRVSMSKTKGKLQIDKKKLEQDLNIDLSDYMTRGRAFTTLRVTERKMKQ